MIDPKMLELSIYDGIPHLLSTCVTDPKKAIVALRWVVREMESRYQAMSKLSVVILKDITNAFFKRRIKAMSFLVVFRQDLILKQVSLFLKISSPHGATSFYCGRCGRNG